MPTPFEAFAAVAQLLGHVDPADAQAVSAFYATPYEQYPDPVKAVIADFLIGQTDVPSDEDLLALQDLVNRPLRDIPAITAPDWVTPAAPTGRYAAGR